MDKIEARADAHAAPLSEVVRTVDEVLRIDWPLSRDDVPKLIVQLGWVSASPLTDDTFVAVPEWSLNRPEIELVCVKGELAVIDLPITDIVRDGQPWRGEFMNDAFAAAVNALVATLGRPDKTTKGAEPLAMWELTNGSRVTVSQIETVVSVSIASPRMANADRRAGT